MTSDAFAPDQAGDEHELRPSHVCDRSHPDAVGGSGRALLAWQGFGRLAPAQGPRRPRRILRTPLPSENLKKKPASNREDHFFELKALKQNGGKLVRCWAFLGDANALIGPGLSTFELEWPPQSGRRVAFPKVDAAGLFSADESLAKILPGQAA